MKKGFTLIELLAVIVILAIISLIAVPIVVNIINDSKKSSEKESIELYMKQVESSIVKANLKEKFNPSICIIQEDSSLICDNNELSKIEITIKGETPTYGSILFDNGKIIKYKNIKLSNLYYHMDIQGNESVTNDPIPAICKREGEVSTELGTKYECKVNDEKTYTFYVLSKESYNINLIMNNNICSDGTEATPSNQCKYPWHDDENTNLGDDTNNYGPDTVMTNLYNATKDWVNIPNMIMNYMDENNMDSLLYGFESIITNKKTKVTTILGKQSKQSEEQILGSNQKPLKARLGTQYEFLNLGCTDIDGSCPGWILDNLGYFPSYGTPSKYAEYCKFSFYDTYGYWLLSSGNQSVYQNRFGRAIAHFGRFADNQTTSDPTGIRPVITIPMDELGIK